MLLPLAFICHCHTTAASKPSRRKGLETTTSSSKQPGGKVKRRSSTDDFIVDDSDSSSEGEGRGHRSAAAEGSSGGSAYEAAGEAEEDESSGECVRRTQPVWVSGLPFKSGWLSKGLGVESTVSMCCVHLHVPTGCGCRPVHLAAFVSPSRVPSHAQVQRVMTAAEPGWAPRRLRVQQWPPAWTTFQRSSSAGPLPQVVHGMWDDPIAHGPYLHKRL